MTRRRRRSELQRSARARLPGDMNWSGAIFGSRCPGRRAAFALTLLFSTLDWLEGYVYVQLRQTFVVVCVMVTQIKIKSIRKIILSPDASRLDPMLISFMCLMATMRHSGPGRVKTTDLTGLPRTVRRILRFRSASLCLKPQIVLSTSRWTTLLPVISLEGSQG